MAENNSNITPENIAEWAASTGIIFPRNLKELLSFEKLHSEIEINLEGCQIDATAILKKINSAREIQVVRITAKKETLLKMAARKGDKNISQNILDKIKKNQENRKSDDSKSQENSAE